MAHLVPQCRLLASSSETKPCYHLANVQKMHLVSVCHHYGNTIWLPWQRPLTNLKIWCRSIICTYGEKAAKIGPVHPAIFDEICRTTTCTHNAISIRLFSIETTGPIFTKILHDIVVLVALALLNHAYTRRYPIPFLDARVTKVGSFPFFHKIGCHANIP